MKTDVTAVGAGIYEPPQMSMVPIRTSGSLLVGSAVGMMTGGVYPIDPLDPTITGFGFGETYGNTATSWEDASSSDWGENFF